MCIYLLACAYIHSYFCLLVCWFSLNSKWMFYVWRMTNLVYQNSLSIVGFHFPITSLRVVITISVETIHTVRVLDNNNYFKAITSFTPNSVMSMRWCAHYQYRLTMLWQLCTHGYSSTCKRIKHSQCNSL